MIKMMIICSWSAMTTDNFTLLKRSRWSATKPGIFLPKQLALIGVGVSSCIRMYILNLYTSFIYYSSSNFCKNHPNDVDHRASCVFVLIFRPNHFTYVHNASLYTKRLVFFLNELNSHSSYKCHNVHPCAIRNVKAFEPYLLR